MSCVVIVRCARSGQRTPQQLLTQKLIKKIVSDCLGPPTSTRRKKFRKNEPSAGQEYPCPTWSALLVQYCWRLTRGLIERVLPISECMPAPYPKDLAGRSTDPIGPN